MSTSPNRTGIDARLAALAARQRGLLHHDQITSAGLSDDKIWRRTTSDRWRAERRNVIAINGAPPTFEQVVAAATMSRGGDVLAAGTTGARLWAMPGDHDLPGIQLLTVIPAKARGNGIVTRRTKLLVPADRAVLRGIPVTSFARTLVDLTGRNDLTDRQLGWILDDGLRRRVTSLEAVRHTVTRLPGGPGRRPSRIVALLEARGVAFQPGASQPESRVAGWLETAGLPTPALDVEVLAGGVTWELDGAYLQARVCWDYHSELIHAGDGSISTFHKDARKALALKNAGWDYSWFTSRSTEAEVVETIGLALRRRAPAA
jgi:hypothetical protein